MTLPKILIVDDSVAACLFMANVLQEAGYKVSIALDGHDALAKALAQRPQCLILDVILPDINGYNVCRQVRVADPQHTVPIILISTKNTPLDRTYGLSQGADRYLSKPFTAETLLQAVWDVLPSHLRSAIAPPLHVPKPPAITLASLIPRRRVDNSTLFTTSSPFAGSMRMDRRTRQLYAALDGQKTVDELCAVMGGGIKETVETLQTLFVQQRIEFCNKEGEIVDPHRFFPDMKVSS